MIFKNKTKLFSYIDNKINQCKDIKLFKNALQYACDTHPEYIFHEKIVNWSFKFDEQYLNDNVIWLDLLNDQEQTHVITHNRDKIEENGHIFFECLRKLIEKKYNFKLRYFS